ncbi:MAG TPA: hypothetical protein ENI62_12065 [Gammaproteobacteria bacterium]|nr:hypothetical protein [Gammaproteobacteria bacterium]
MAQEGFIPTKYAHCCLGCALLNKNSGLALKPVKCDALQAELNPTGSSCSNTASTPLFSKLASKKYGAIEDHFGISAELEMNLKSAGKHAIYHEVSRMAEVVYVRQKQALGLDHAVACAAHWIGSEPFGVALADELIVAEMPAMQQLRHIHEETGCSVIGLMQAPLHLVSRYGIVQAGQEKNGLLRLLDMVEKPARVSHGQCGIRPATP